MPVTRFISRMRDAIRTHQPRPVILMYHRVAFVQHDPWGLAVDPERFEEQIAYAKQHRSPMSVDEFVERLRSKTLPANALAVTFDDGYSDNLHQAEPLLRHAGIPAAIFVVSGALRRDREFWWDELDRIVFESGPTGAPIKEFRCS